MIYLLHGRRWLGVVGVLAATGIVGAGVVHGPDALRRVDAFTVQHVQVTGTRFVEPYSVIRAAGITRETNLFDDSDAWREGILSLPMVDDVAIRRHPPATLTIDVREAEPVALVAGDGLRPVDAGGRVLELELAGIVLDLPVVTGVVMDEGVVAGQGQAAIQLLLLIRSHDPRLADRVSQVEAGRGALRVVFRGNGPDALFPMDARPVHLTQLRLAYADLAGRGELGRAGRIDVRFRDQVVVSFHRVSVRG
jgi:hypothetical protein